MESTAFTEAMAVYQSWLLSCHIRRIVHEHPNICCQEFPMSDENNNIIGNIPYLYSNGDSLEKAAENLEKIALQSCFLAFSDALDKVYGDCNRFENPLRAIIYMFRCVSAHHLVTPEWNITVNKYRRKYVITKINFIVDFSNMSNRRITYKDFGGMSGLWKLMNYCLGVIKSQSNGSCA